MASFPQHSTFAPGELARREDALRTPGSAATEADSLASASFPARPVSAVNAADAVDTVDAVNSAPVSRSGSRLLKEYACPVAYPDGSEGMCRYERRGPAAHRFQFLVGNEANKAILATQWLYKPLGNRPEDIEQKAEELTPVAFAEAVERERKEYFGRASEGGGREKHPERFQMSAERAKRRGGQYALCLPLGDAGERLLPVTEVFATLAAADDAWREVRQEKGENPLVVACCNRLDRCWERPRYNALYKDFPAMAPRPKQSAE